MRKEITCHLLVNASQEALEELEGKDAASSTPCLQLRKAIKRLIGQGGSHFLIEPLDIDDWWVVKIILEEPGLSYSVVLGDENDNEWLEEQPDKKQFILNNAREVLHVESSEYYISKYAELLDEIDLSAD